MAQLTHTPVVTALRSLETLSQTKEEQLRAIARQRAVWDYNTDIITAREEGIEEGIQKGREEGMKIFLRSMIETKFGQPLPDWVLSRLRTATPEQLQQWGISLAQVQRLEDIFDT
ncbi:hypothetical protein [Aquaspirillum serpens]|uniref:hypothetical protein n=1 Tax=Aquaspirillum serpens TaxID=190 RepID=UPI0003B4A40F|nr:hypothetical protein [Aquaspirillum serpens]